MSTAQGGDARKSTQPRVKDLQPASNDERLHRVFKSNDGIAAAMSEDLCARRSRTSYDYLVGAGDAASGSNDGAHFIYHSNRKPTGGRSLDYLDGDQNRTASAPYTRDDHGHYPPCLNFESDSDERLLDHQIRMLEAKKAAATSRKFTNSGPVGLLAFGLTTILLNLHNTGRFPLSTVVVGMGICLGGGAQFVVGLLEWVRGNAFAYVAFTSYGAFWLSLVCVWTLPNTAAGTSVIVEPATGYFVGVYLLMWGIFSFVMLLCTIRMNVAIFLVFLTVTLLFLMLGCSSMANSAAGLRAAGYEGIVCGSLALYLAFAEILNEAWDRTILPVIPMTQLLDWLSSRTQKSTGGSVG
ncbi:GPR1/FUN34/yaaH family, putative [Leishmania tarentolae]|uniref:GPR1/FUN34/yaaH family, putative n=1 Tax=Leishmania tarentolae TaxID=5689 RepID=A0A640K7Y8_LEITA|nr:GPR1/FUN34/yaaH family, putative [Leishmania tarentolae]